MARNYVEEGKKRVRNNPKVAEALDDTVAAGILDNDPREVGLSLTLMAGMAEVVRGANTMDSILAEAEKVAQPEERARVARTLGAATFHLVRLYEGFTAALAREAHTFRIADGIERTLGSGTVYGQSPQNVVNAVQYLHERNKFGKVEAYVNSDRGRRVEVTDLVDQSRRFQINIAYIAEGTSECGSKQLRVCDDGEPKTEDSCAPSSCTYGDNACATYKRCLGVGKKDDCTPKHLNQGIPYAAGVEGATAKVVGGAAKGTAARFDRVRDEGYRQAMKSRLLGVGTRLQNAGGALLGIYEMLPELKKK